MEDAEFGLMLAAALDAIHACELAGDEWRSRLLDNGNILALDNDGCDLAFNDVQAMHDEMAVS